MKVVSLFTGCGGLDLGLHRAGHEIILQCECDPGAQQVLRKAFPGTLLVPDVCALQRLPKETELVAAGFPCIDVSRAGLRQGLDGPSTGLVRHVFRLLAQARDDQRAVPWVLLENVEALLDRCHGGPPLVSWVVKQLEDLGYRSWAHRVLCSAGFGVPNRRRRVFILASMHGDARDVLLGQGLQRCMGACLSAVGGDCWECFDPDDDPTTGNRSEAAMLRCSYALDLGNARSAAGVDVVPTFTTSNARICLLLSNGRYGALRIEDTERLQGLPVGHTQPCYPVCAPGIKQHSRAGAVRDSDADTQARARFALLGNAVTVQVAEWVGRRLADPYSLKYMATDNDTPLPREHQHPKLTDTDWQPLREVRLDQLRGDGAAGGQARLVSRGQTNWEAARPGGVASDDEEGASEEEKQGCGGGGCAAGGVGGSAEQAGAGGAGACEGAGGGEGASGGSRSAGEGPADAARTAAEGPAGSAPGGDAADAAEDEARAADGQGGDAAGGGDQEGAAQRSASDREDGQGEDEDEDEDDDAAAAADGKVVTQRYAQGRLSTSWPKAAWFIAGHGRWGLKDASDAPLKSRFVPLGEFIRRVGPAPPDVALVTYLQRLKEQGWNVDRTERKMLMCGVAGLGGSSGGGGAPGISQAGVLAGMLDPANCDAASAASSIGRLVWAPLWSAGTKRSSNIAAATAAAAPSSSAAAAACAANGADVYWACEAIDPFDPPRGFKLLPEHRLALPPGERKLHLPSDAPAGGKPAGADAGEAPPAPGEGGAPPDAPAVAAQGSVPGGGGEAGAATSGAVSGCTADAAAEGADAHVGARVRRKLLLVWFHSNSHEWRYEDELLPFQEHRARFKAEAQALAEAGKLARPQDWRRAYHEAKHCHTILMRAAKVRARVASFTGFAGPAAYQLAAAELSSDPDSSEGEEDGDGHRAAVAGRAAKQALAVNLNMPRCKVCETCTQSTGSSSRRCLLVRANAAAAAGHTGAQLAVLEGKVVGAELEVWWPLDEAWYRGVVTAYDALRVRHTIHYADGDVEIIPLWAPQQRIRLRSEPSQWVAKAAQLAAERAAAASAAAKDVEAARLRVPGAGGLLPESVEAPLTALEQERADNIQRNKEALARILAAEPLPDAAQAAAVAHGPATPAPAPRRAPSADDGSPTPMAAALAAGGGSGGGSSSGALAAAAAAPPKERKRSRPPKPQGAGGGGGGGFAAASCPRDHSDETLAKLLSEGSGKRQAASLARLHIYEQMYVLADKSGNKKKKKKTNGGP